MMPRRPPPFWRIFDSGEYFTIWSWLVPLPLSLSIAGAVGVPHATLDVLFIAATTVITEIAVGVVFLLHGVLERTTGSRALRVIIVQVGLAVSALVRCGVAGVLSISFGLDQGPDAAGLFLSRLIVVYTVYSSILNVVATATMMLARRRTVLAALARVAAALAEQCTAGVEMMAAVTAQVAVVRERLYELWNTVLTATPAARGAALRSLADGARDFSHSLHVPHEVRPAQTVVWVSARPSVLSPAPPGVAVGVYLIAMVPHDILMSLFDEPLPWVTTALTYLVVCGAGEVVLWRIARGRYATVLIVTVTLCTATIATLLTTPLTPDVRWTWLVQVTTYVVSAMLASACSEVARRMADDEAQLTEKLAEYSADELDGRRRAHSVVDSTVSLLHNEVQGESLRLALLSDRGDQVDLSTLTRALNCIGEENVPRTPNETRGDIEGVLEAWGYALSLEVTAAAEVWPILTRDGMSHTAITAVSEGLTNALKYADRHEARVEFEVIDIGVRIRVSSPGRLRGGRGRGLDDLRRVCERVSLTEANGTVVLDVDLAQPEAP